VVLCPGAPCTAFPHDRRPFDKPKLEVNGSKINYEKTPFWTTLATPTGLPVTTVPIGADNSGLLIGMQIIGPPLRTTRLSRSQNSSSVGWLSVQGPDYLTLDIHRILARCRSTSRVSMTLPERIEQLRVE
jgi:hypothetical protein